MDRVETSMLYRSLSRIFEGSEQSGKLYYVFVQCVLVMEAFSNARESEATLPSPVEDSNGFPAFVRFQKICETLSLYLRFIIPRKPWGHFLSRSFLPHPR